MFFSIIIFSLVLASIHSVPHKTTNGIVCGANSRYSECASACPLTCQNVNNPPKYCVLMCVQTCECKRGFVIADNRTTTGDCIRPENCSFIK
ncbi:hypothetical protein BLOT_009375 [Blomia tropicalis]|nr:hypothetical protein BLOT_009375 [Blomia tropicalis]